VEVGALLMAGRVPFFVLRLCRNLPESPARACQNWREGLGKRQKKRSKRVQKALHPFLSWHARPTLAIHCLQRRAST